MTSVEAPKHRHYRDNIRPTTPKVNDESWLVSRPPLRGSFPSDIEEHNSLEHKHNKQRGHNDLAPKPPSVRSVPLENQSDTQPEHKRHKHRIKIIRHRGTTQPPHPVHNGHHTQTPGENQHALTAQVGIPETGSVAPQRTPSSSMDVDAENKHNNSWQPSRTRTRHPAHRQPQVQHLRLTGRR